ncbi:hypothetical protein KS4_27450 [Poriferisphaera corsica]|uniref:Uncharacterized protein n=1 Tax=Poriferisphaera corsica TaxID=2528020 RepID=A0A517YWR9_9BACT|nr:hypothetical protein [Poriferisphaera corsica]QDU34674.1 hypothetical protein KS4_27450 [Poriferisphaera corsica]
MIWTADNVYQYVNDTISVCKTQKHDTIAKDLENAMKLGGSGLEILGGIKQVLIENQISLNRLGFEQDKLDQVIQFINQCYMR